MGVSTEPYIFEIVALQPPAMRIAYLRIPQSPVIVRDVDALHARLKANGFASRSAAPVTITTGPNRGSKVVYMSDPDYLVELFERRTAPVAAGQPA
jgi:hypothetical protein